MKNTIKLFGFIALVAVIGFGFAGCDVLDKLLDDGSPEITTTSLPGGMVGTAYSQTLMAKGDTPITWSRESGALPAGLSLATTGGISGTPSATGTSTFTVKAENEKGSDTKQLTIIIAAAGGGGTAPSAPTGVTATAASSSSITVSWTAVTGATGYTVYRSLSSGGTYTSVGTPTASPYTNTGLTANTTYYYQVTAKNANGESLRSTAVSATTTTSSAGGPGSTRETAIDLTENIWADGTIAAATSDVWYKFDVTSGTTYRIWWNEKSSVDGTKTANVVVGARYADSNTWIFGGTSQSVDSGSWIISLAPGFSANQNGTVYLRVCPYNYNISNIGTFGIVYTTGSNPMPGIPAVDPPSATTLTANQWEHGTILTNNAVWYKFTVTSGTTYNVWWNNKPYGPAQNTKTGDVVLGARYSGSDTWIFGGTPTAVNSGWSSSVYASVPSFTADRNGTVYVRVSTYNNNITNIGTFALVYSTGDTRPGLRPPAWTGSTTISINSTAAWNEALTKLKGQTGNYTLTVTGNVEVPGVVYGGGLFSAIPFSFGTMEDGFPLQVTLNGNGKLYNTEGSELFICGAGQTVIIDSANLTLDGEEGRGSVISVYSGGTLELKNGTITNGAGNGVSVPGGTFIMRGGKITANKEGGVLVGSNILESPIVFGTFTMYGGEISGNTANPSYSPRGGGVRVNSGTTFTMHDGKISGNTTTGLGGGVYVYTSSSIADASPGTFTMLGGTISGNTGLAGGGVYVDGIFQIVKGTIYGSDESDNDLKNTASSPVAGAALYKTDNGTAKRGTITGAIFSGTDLITTGNAHEDTIKVDNGTIVP